MFDVFGVNLSLGHIFFFFYNLIFSVFTLILSMHVSGVCSRVYCASELILGFVCASAVKTESVAFSLCVTSLISRAGSSCVLTSRTTIYYLVFIQSEHTGGTKRSL